MKRSVQKQTKQIRLNIATHALRQLVPTLFDANDGINNVIFTPVFISHRFETMNLEMPDVCQCVLLHFHSIYRSRSINVIRLRVHHPRLSPMGGVVCP